MSKGSCIDNLVTPGMLLFTKSKQFAISTKFKNSFNDWETQDPGTVFSNLSHNFLSLATLWFNMNLPLGSVTLYFL